jgi:hypothetical protein
LTVSEGNLKTEREKCGKPFLPKRKRVVEEKPKEVLSWGAYSMTHMPFSPTLNWW